MRCHYSDLGIVATHNEQPCRVWKTSHLTYLRIERSSDPSGPVVAPLIAPLGRH